MDSAAPVPAINSRNDKHPFNALRISIQKGNGNNAAPFLYLVNSCKKSASCCMMGDRQGLRRPQNQPRRKVLAEKGSGFQPLVGHNFRQNPKVIFAETLLG